MILFSYVPMYGIQIAFKDFRPAQGIAGSQWVGMEHFVRFLRTPLFVRVVRNTLGISLYSLLVGFPVPILLAIMINEVRSRWFQKTVQMITYAPYFISTVAMCGMLLLFLWEKNDQAIKSAANIPGVKTALVNTLNVYDILNADKFIVVK
ncbi:MAG: 50S ribosomal protein L4, partial [Eubacteriales bacterium]|nr:50S ribosomal protein L4 [Eubacteriales bacterium]